MSSGLSHFYEEEEDKIKFLKQKRFGSMKDYVLSLELNTIKGEEMLWIFENREKITRNFKLIELLG